MNSEQLYTIYNGSALETGAVLIPGVHLSNATDMGGNSTPYGTILFDNTTRAAGDGMHVGPSYDYFGAEALHRWKSFYEPYHGYLSVVVCAFGIIMNLFNVVVLTRPKMRSITNMILTGLAISDGLTMISYIPFALQFYVLYGIDSTPDRNSHPWIYFFLFHVNFSVTVHTISIWLCVLLAVFRYICVRSTSKQMVISENVTLVAIIAVYLVTVIFLIPNYLSLTIVAGADPKTNQTMYDVVPIPASDRYGYWLTSVNFWIHAIMIKIIPCALMIISGALLLRTMHIARQKQFKMRKTPGMNDSAANRRKQRDHTRTTRMLTIVIFLFLLTELPQGILALLSGTNDDFFLAYYMPLGDLMDAIALINNAINFVLYCSMSKQFRDTFLELFCCCVLQNRSGDNGGNKKSGTRKNQEGEMLVLTRFTLLFRKRKYTPVTTTHIDSHRIEEAEWGGRGGDHRHFPPPSNSNDLGALFVCPSNNNAPP